MNINEITTKSIYECFKKSIGKNSIVVIHSSLIGFNVESSKFKWMVLAALRKLMLDGITVVIPTFTFSFCKGVNFNVQKSKSETGVLGDWFLQLDGVSRTKHGIYSFAVGGSLSQEIAKCKNSSTFGKDSTFGFFDRKNVRMVMFGCGWEYCTQFHYYEEKYQVPYRNYKKFRGIVEDVEVSERKTFQMYVRNLGIVSENNFTPLIDKITYEGNYKKIQLGSGTVQSVDCSSIARISTDLLSDDLLSLTSDQSIVKHNLENIALRNSNPDLNISVLGSNNTEILSKEVKRKFDGFFPHRSIELLQTKFGQIYQEILDLNSSLYTSNPDFSFFVDNIVDLYKTRSVTGLLISDLSPVKVYVKMIKEYASRATGVIFVNTFEVSTNTVFRNYDANHKFSVNSLVKTSNKILKESLSDCENVHLFDLKRAYILHNDVIVDDRLWYLGRFIYSKSFSQFLAVEYVSLALSSKGESVRLILLDLDNTIWGGVLGEDGIQGLQLGGDYPGNAFFDFQKVVMQLHARGIAIGIVSKNNETDALRAINTLDNMVINLGSISIYKINWNSKVSNIVEISNEIGIGLKNILFIDDNPVERAQVEKNLPEVKILNISNDPSTYSASLIESPYLQITSLTKEDEIRNNSYTSLKNINSERNMFSNIEEFYASINPQLTITNLNEKNISRAVQLINKTNQFNTTAKRYTKNDLKIFMNAKNNHSVHVLGYKDRFSEFEYIGVTIICRKGADFSVSEMELFLLSCRVLGRGIEHGVLSWWSKTAAKEGVRLLTAEIVPTERNTPVLSLYKNHGFIKESGKHSWRKDNEIVINTPDWIEVVDKTELTGE